MDILDINTDDLRKYVSMAEKANTNINEAYKILDKIVKHEDWICPQRDDLITYTNKNKSEIKVIQDWSDRFFNTIKSASEAFDTCEKDAISSFGTLDGLVSSIASIQPASFSVPGIGPIKAISLKNFSEAWEGLF